VHFEIRRAGPHSYLYLAETVRTPKGPRRAWQFYVGSPESLHRRLRGSHAPLTVRSFAYGRPAALLHAAEQTGLLEALERHLPSRHRSGLSVAQLLLLQLLGRAERPLSREAMAQWFPASALPLLWGTRERPSARVLRLALRKMLASGRLDGSGTPVLSRAALRKVEEDLFRRLLARGIPPKWLLFDTTNFYTYHREGRFSRKGHSKDRRADKNLTGLGLVTLGNLPVLSEVYAGNESDPKLFAHVLEALQVRLERLEVATDRLTLVFDRGVNSTENFEATLGAMHVIAALNRQDARALLATPLSKFHEIARDPEGNPILGFPTVWEGFGQTWRTLVVYRVATAHHQRARWERTKDKVLGQVSQWREALGRGAPGRSQKALMRKLVELVPRDYHGIFDYGVEWRDGKFWPRCKVPGEAEARLRASFGKTTLITDLAPEALPEAEFVQGYASRAAIEEDFKWLKDRFVLSVKPVWVWNESAVAGHVFLCVLGLLLLRYLQWEARELELSIPAMLEELENVRIAVLRQGDGRPKVVLEQMTKVQARLVEKLQLGSLIPG
jgi:transposase